VDPTRNPFAPGAGTQPPELDYRELLPSNNLPPNETRKESTRHTPWRQEILLKVVDDGAVNTRKFTGPPLLNLFSQP